MQAAQAFTEALEFIDDNLDPTTAGAAAPADSSTASSMLRQQITLYNNRSAMYEKAAVPELALEDCSTILELQMDHSKARARKLRILESLQRWPEALEEVCAAQLLFMQAHRTQMRMGLPVPPPPVPQSKMEEILNHIIPQETAKYEARLQFQSAAADSTNSNSNNVSPTNRKLPGAYTILQLLRSYTGYNAWMAQAARDGSVDKLTKELQAVAADSPVEKVPILLKRGQRYVYDRKYEEATADFEEAYSLVDGKDDVIQALPEDTYPRLLEWTGMVRHWHYNLESAMACLEKAVHVEPENSLLYVKQAGVQLDSGKQEEALQLFEKALLIDPDATDALLHRSNLRLMQGKAELAKTDLEKCVRLRPNHTMARLRLAAILVPLEDLEGAQQQLNLAEAAEPNSSEVHSYRGELNFAQGQMEDARQNFEKAIALEPENPTPYVNAAMALMNSPLQPGQMPDTARVLSLLESAINVDEQFTAAYIHLGQLKLGTATDLEQAREVIKLYDKGLDNARSPEEIKELCGMRVLAVAQVEAAAALKMETFNFQ